MTIEIVCRGFNISSSIERYIHDNLEKHIMKFFNHSKDNFKLKILITKEGYQYQVKIIINDSKGEFIKITENSNNAYNSVNKAIIHLSVKLSKYKEERINKYRHNKHLNDKKVLATEYLFKDKATKIVDQDTDYVKYVDNFDVEYSKTYIKMMSIDDAIIEMDLLSMSSMLFINSETKKVNMLYFNDHGNIACIELEDLINTSL